jgi:hypothetical protein
MPLLLCLIFRLLNTETTVPARGKVYSIQHYVIKFVSDLQQFGGFLCVLRHPPPIKTDRQDIAEILLKVVLNTITLILTQ